MRYEATLKVSRDTLAYIDNALADPDFMGEDDTIRKTAHFPNGYEMDIKCCGAQDDVAWTEAVLFNPDGGQVAYTDPADEFSGEWELEDDDGNTYRVNVVPEDRP